MTEKQKLEADLHELKTEKFKNDQLKSEIVSLRNQIGDDGGWRSEKLHLQSEIEKLMKENENLTRSLRNEKSQRLILVSRVEELERNLETADTMIGGRGVSSTSSEQVADGASVKSQRGSVVSSIPDVRGPETRRDTLDLMMSDDARIPTTSHRAPETLRPLETAPATRLVLPGFEGPGIRKSSLDSTPRKLHEQPTIAVQQPPPEVSFIDVEQRGSAKTDSFNALFGNEEDHPAPSTQEAASPRDVADIFGASNVGSSAAPDGLTDDTWGNSWGQQPQQQQYMERSQQDQHMQPQHFQQYPQPTQQPSQAPNSFGQSPRHTAHRQPAQPFAQSPQHHPQQPASSFPE
jgi:hypothetical protein